MFTGHEYQLSAHTPLSTWQIRHVAQYRIALELRAGWFEISDPGKESGAVPSKKKRERECSRSLFGPDYAAR
jgi:hypothetical protein